MTWKDICALYHQKDEQGAVFKHGFNAARAMKKAILEGKPISEVSPPTSVRTTRKQLHSMYFEVGFVSESEYQKITGGLSSKQMGHKPQTLTLEDGVTTLSGFMISLWGMSSEFVHAIRKIQVAREVSVEMNEELLRPERQIRKGQGEDTFRYVAGIHTQNAWCNPMRGNARLQLRTVQELRDRANEIREEGEQDTLCYKFQNKFVVDGKLGLEAQGLRLKAYYGCYGSGLRALQELG